MASVRSERKNELPADPANIILQHIANISAHLLSDEIEEKISVSDVINEIKMLMKISDQFAHLKQNALHNIIGICDLAFTKNITEGMAGQIHLVNGFTKCQLGQYEKAVIDLTAAMNYDDKGILFSKDISLLLLKESFHCAENLRPHEQHSLSNYCKVKWHYNSAYAAMQDDIPISSVSAVIHQHITVALWLINANIDKNQQYYKTKCHLLRSLLTIRTCSDHLIIAMLKYASIEYQLAVTHSAPDDIPTIKAHFLSALCKQAERSTTKSRQELYKTALKIDPENSVINSNLSAAIAAMEETTEQKQHSHEIYIDLIKHNPDLEHKENLLMSIAKKLSYLLNTFISPSKKIDLFNILKQESPHLGIQSMCELSKLYAEEKEHLKAIEIAHETLILEDRPDLIALVKYFLATQYQHLSQHEIAKKEIIQLIEFNLNKKIQYNLSTSNAYITILMACEKALIQNKYPDIQQNVTRNNHKFETLFKKGQVQLGQGNFPGALRSFDKLLWLNAQSCTAYHHRSQAKAGLKEFDSALDDINLAIWLIESGILLESNEALENYIQYRETIFKLMTPVNEAKPQPSPVAPKPLDSVSPPKKPVPKINKAIKTAENIARLRDTAAINAQLNAERLRQEEEEKQLKILAAHDAEQLLQLKDLSRQEKNKRKALRKKAKKLASKEISPANENDESNSSNISMMEEKAIETPCIPAEEKFTPPSLPINPIPLQIELPEEAVLCLEKLNSHNTELKSYVVGGLPRDLLLKQLNLFPDTESKLAEEDHIDIDIVTSLLPEEVGKIYGIQPSEFDPNLFQIGRIDIYCSTFLRDDPTLATDANRRDFTINTFYANAKGEVFDPTRRGYTDLLNKHFVSIQATLRSFEEDPIRMLRAIYFKSKLAFDFKNHEAICASIRKHASLLLTKTPPGRVNAWMNKLFCDGKALANFELLMEFGLLQKLFSPENATDEELISCQIAMQNNIQHFRKVFQTADLQYRNNESTTKTKLNLVYAFFMICNKLTAANNKLIAKNFEKYPGKIEYLLSIARTLFYSQQSFSGVTTHGMYATTANPTSDPLAPTFANDQTKEAQYNHVH